MTALSHLHALEFKGNDASQFLHANLSGDIASITPGEAGFAACCNPAGRVLGLLLVRPEPERCLAICAARLAKPLTDWLGRYVLRADVSITARADLAVAPGDAGAAGLPSAIDLPNPTRIRFVLAPLKSLDDPAEPALQQDWAARELAAGIAWLGPATSGHFLPQMLGLERIGALSFSKGCYPGQEIIARTRYLGKLKRRPVLCRLHEPFTGSLMDEVILRGDGAEAPARVVDYARRRDGTTCLLAVARTTEEFTISSLVHDTQVWAGSFEFPA